mmetsp:Transcript_14690/g.27606  ORF Transcript_14690/g.27606 Transcript_14690/m.27606 type:complete len:600 (+) Transcript_14690:89-1888(+)
MKTANTTTSSLSLHIQSIIADALTNVSSSNPNTTSQHVRKEAWTEVFGNLHLQKQNQVASIKDDTSSTPLDHIRDVSNRSDIELLQYRMAWEVQLLLRHYTIPHTVMNSPYLSNQCTGALPQLRHISSQRMIGNCDILPLLVKELNLHNHLNEQQHTEVTVLCSLLYRQNTLMRALRYGDFNAWEQVHRERSIQACVHHSHPILWKNGNTSDLSGNKNGNGNINIGGGGGGGDVRGGSGGMTSWWTFGNGFARLQAWAERCVYLNQIVLDSSMTTMNNHDNTHDPTERIKSLAREGYKALDCKLKQNGGVSLILQQQQQQQQQHDRDNDGSNDVKLTIADIQLFGHLAEALCDIHLVTIVAEYEHLVAFYQRIYEKYFGKGYLKKCISDHYEKHTSCGKQNRLSEDQLIREQYQWIKDNDLVNASNQFNHVPLKDDCGPMGWRFKMGGGSVGGGGGEFMDAIKIMQEVAVHCRDLKEVLLDMKLQKDKEETLVAKDSMGKDAGSLFRKWRMGGDIFNVKGDRKSTIGLAGKNHPSRNSHDYDNNDDDDEEDADEFTKRSREQMKKMMRQAKKNDEMWISAVAGATVLGLLASLSVSGSE